MDSLKESINKFFHFNIIDTVIIILVSIILYKTIQRLILKNINREKIENKMNQKGRTYLKLITNVLRYIFIIITGLIVLQTNGVNVTSMLAGVGIAGAIIGLAVQDALKDIIRGISLLSDEYFKVGDVIYYNNLTGKVLELGLKATKIKEVATGNIITIANRNMEQVELVSHLIHINIPMPYELKVSDAEKVIKEIIDNIKNNSNVENSRYLGVNNLADSSIHYLIQVSCNPEAKLQVRRDSLGTILKIMEKNKISVPYNQIDVHMDNK